MRTIIFFLFLTSFVYAHKLNLFLEQEQNRVFVSSYFASGAFCKSCKVEVKNRQNEILQIGKTNSNGEFIINKLEPFITVGVDAGSGHLITKSLEIKEVVNVEKINQELESLRQENQRLKTQIKLLEQKNSMSDTFKMIIALFVIAGIFLFLKRVKK